MSAPIQWRIYVSVSFRLFQFKLLTVHPGPRLSSQRELQQTPLLRNIDFTKILQKETKPPYKPPEDHLNCDPSLELEEMIVEAKPLHKKKKRLAKQRSQQKDISESSIESNFIKEFIVYNRYKELKKRAMEKKENEWQDELNTLMAKSQVCNLNVIEEMPNENAATNLLQSTTSAIQSNSCSNVVVAACNDAAGTCTSTCATSKEAETIEYIEFIDRTPSPKST